LCSDFVLPAIPLTLLGCERRVGVKNHEALKTGAVVRELAQAVQHEIHDLLA